jgi:G3E family GTPase
MIPLAVLTGYLGSGKTTLLARLLKSPRFARTAVIINEFGEVALDHDLIETSEESFVELASGCLCCRARGDIALTLSELVARRDRGTARFDRVVIETSGLADPAPILHALMGDAVLAERLALAGVATTVDAVNAPATLAREREAVKQVAVADQLILTKTDLLPGTADELEGRLRRINPAAPLLTARFGDIDPERLFAGARQGHGLPAPAAAGEQGQSGHFGEHDALVSSFALLREQPMPAAVLTLLLEALADHCGADLLRLKGIVNVAESPDRPAVVHGVQHLFHPPQWLAAWPSDDRRSRLVFIVRGVSAPWVSALLRAIEIEVGEVAKRG